ncbi:FHA domain-containing protein [Tessaracoccus sp. OH4464_COT-324]|nr:FHA domain-containing protein [Tessaracoccus sp. OH4464_COT-324]
MRSVVRCCSGSDIAIVWPGGAALIDSIIGAEIAEDIWVSLRHEPTLDTFRRELISRCSGQNFALPAFAVGVLEEDGWRLACSGRFAIQRKDSFGESVLSGLKTPSWVEHRAPAGTGITLGRCGYRGYPLLNGLVLASGIMLAERDLPGEAERSQGDSFSQYNPYCYDPEASESYNPEQKYDLRGETAVITLSGEAIEYPVREFLAVPDSVPMSDQGGVAPLARETFLDPYSQGEDSAEDGTVLDPEQAAVPMQISSQAGVETVQARSCERGHANPPQRKVCFVCSAEVSGEAEPLQRPPLGEISTEAGETVELLGPVIIGRKPEPSAIRTPKQPQLLEIPNEFISGSHLAITIEGWKVLAQDLGSTNGSRLRRGNSQPVRLSQAKIPLMDGDLLQLGPKVILRVKGIPS